MARQMQIMNLDKQLVLRAQAVLRPLDPDIEQYTIPVVKRKLNEIAIEAVEEYVARLEAAEAATADAA